MTRSSLHTLAAVVLSSSALLACGGATPPSAAAPSAPKTVFTDVGAYASAPVATSAASAHGAKKLPSPTKTACLSCHKAGGAAPSFVFAGTVFADDATTKPAADVEMRVVDAKGVATSAHTDADGNFWAKGDAAALPAHAGARNALKTSVMGGVVDNADCNACHDAAFPMLLTPPK